MCKVLLAAMLTLITAAGPALAGVEIVDTHTKGGVAISMDVAFPEGAGPFPAVLIAPGKGYHKDLPLIDGLFEAAPKQGFAAVRFNWFYFVSPHENAPTPSLQGEAAELQQVLDWALSEARIDSTRIFLAGKSLGTVVANRIFHNNPQVRGEILLTPLIPDLQRVDFLYPGLIEEMRPILMVVGDSDPDNCPAPLLYKAVSESNGNLSVVVLGGDHGMQVGAEDEAFQEHLTERNIALAVETMAAWMERNQGLGR